jgi:hypothetical protein
MSTPKPPQTSAAGMLAPFMSARRRHEVCDIVFEMIGGVQRLAHEAERDPKWFYSSLWVKGLPRAATTEHTLDTGVDALLDKLDKAANAKTIEGNFTEVPDAAD